jgi:transposase
LAKTLKDVYGLQAHPSTIRRLLKTLGYRWRRARPAPSWRQDPDKQSKLQSIEEAIHIQASYTDVFFVDEASIDLLPKMGFSWRPIGEQKTVVTPGRNESRYLAAGLHKDTGKLTWTEGKAHDTELILSLLQSIHLRYRRSRQIVIIMDNAPSHTSNKTKRWLEAHDRFDVRWQPTYTPQVNRVERLWKQLHRTVTRNHRHQTMESLMEAVRSWMEAVESFPDPSARNAQIDPSNISRV